MILLPKHRHEVNKRAGDPIPMEKIRPNNEKADYQVK
jgi:hypothetical protein